MFSEVCFLVRSFFQFYNESLKKNGWTTLSKVYPGGMLSFQINFIKNTEKRNSLFINMKPAKRLIFQKSHIIFA